jgi:hypothetical protein
MKRSLAVTAAVGLLALAGRAHAEPMFLSRQYTRCTTCHYSPTGGGLLTPYGRGLTRELSTMSGHPAAESEPGRGEESFLFGRLGQRTGPVDLGIDVRPAHLDVDSGGFATTEDFMMDADLLAAVRAHGWTLYGEIGREPVPDGPKIASYEYWIARDSPSEGGFGFRLGRFLPAYGIRLSDHTALTRLPLGFDVYDQVLGLEVSHSGERHLLQVSASPGPAPSVFQDDGRRAFTASGRLQLDLGPRSALVFSGLFRSASQLQPRSALSGVAFGIAPLRRLSVWTEADLQSQAALADVEGAGGGTGFTLLNETSFEIYRGLWLKLSPQLRTEPGHSGSGTFRTLIEADLLPRTHWNVDLSLYRDVDRFSSLSTRTILAQLHLYL